MMGVTSLHEINSGPFTAADLESMPDDGRRYELIDGVLIVSPSPRPLHQRVVRNLALLLAPRVPAGLELFFAPLDVHLADDSVVEPDLLLVRDGDVTPHELRGPLLLAVEVLSSSTRRFDLTLKKDRYAAAGCPSYWVIDPGELEKSCSITVWELADGAYREAAHAVGDETCAVSRPFPVEIVPSALVSQPG